jgi:hypothetical protein
MKVAGWKPALQESPRDRSYFRQVVPSVRDVMSPPNNPQGATMTAFIKKYALILSFLLILSLFVLARLYPSVGIPLLIIFLVFGFVLNSWMIIKKHRKVYLEGVISQIAFIGRVCLEITGLLATMILAGILGRYIAELATAQMSNTVVKFVAGIVIGLCVGIAVGFLIKRTTTRLRQVPNSLMPYRADPANGD